MKSLYEQEKEIFARHADLKGGKYMSVEKARRLLGRDAVKYAFNAVRDYPNHAAFRNIYGNTEVLTMEIKKGLYNAYQTPDYLDRPDFAKN